MAQLGIISFYIPLFALVLLAKVPYTDEKVVSCGGFVVNPATTSNIELPALLTVKLYNEEGNLKYETECNPTTGYYMIPIYSKGKYQLQLVAPDGWIFEPSNRDIEIRSDDEDGESPPCTEDLNFQFHGFAIKGRLIGAFDQTSSSQSKEIHVQLLSSKSGEIVEDTLVNGPDGSYEFRVPPGSYELAVGEGAACVDRKKLTVDTSRGPAPVGQDMRIIGHDVVVTVSDEGGSLASGARVSMLSASQLTFASSQAPSSPLPEERKKSRDEWAYSLVTDEDGVARFSCVPPGVYTISAEKSSEDGRVKMNFLPTQLEMGQQRAEPTLVADSFDLRSTISSTRGKGIAQAEIWVNGEKWTTTDDQGHYVLEGMKAAKVYSIEAQKPQFEFNQLEWAASSSAPLPRFQITGLSLCGNVMFGKGADSVLSLKVTRIDGEQNKQSDQNIEVSAADNGSFCRTLAPGQYRVEPTQTSSQSPFTPKSLEVDLSDGPFLNAMFTQFQASISGEIIAMNEEGFDALTVQLLTEAQNIAHEIRPGQDGKFRFEYIASGKYLVRVSDALGMIWWERDEFTVEVVDKDVIGLQFLQTGYSAQIEAALKLHLVILGMHAIQKYSLEQGDQQLRVELNQGLNRVYFPRRGRWRLEIADSCHEFYNSANEGLLSVPQRKGEIFALGPKRSRASITISLPDKQKSQLKEKFSIAIRDTSSADSQEVEIGEPHMVGDRVQTTYKFSAFFEQGTKGHRFIVTPKSASGAYLFIPASFSYSFDGECGSTIATFNATVGKYIEGQVKPSVPGVKVKAKATDEQQLVSETDSRGHYKLGPVWEPNDYEIELEKEGYAFTRDERNPRLFKSSRLSQLRLHFRDADGGKPLAEVLVSLSGPGSYRSNNVVDKTGVISFIGLAPGEYFVRPILLEYKFDTVPASVAMKEGEVQELVLTAKRIAYSVFGSVSCLDGQRIPAQVRIDAISPQCENHQEEDEFDANRGPAFRIRGLKPKCEYRVRVRQATWKGDGGADGGRVVVWNSYPPFINVQTGEEDRRDVNFILVPSITTGATYTVMGQVIFDSANANFSLQSVSYKVGLSRAGETSPLYETQLSTPVSTFISPSLALKEEEVYTVGIAKSEAVKLKIRPIAHSFSPPHNSSVIYVRLHARPVERTDDTYLSASKTNYFGFIAVLLLSITFFIGQDTLKAASEKVKEAIWELTTRRRNVTHIADVKGVERQRRAGIKKNG